MDLIKCEELIKKCLSECGLGGWKMNFDITAHKCLGKCSFKEKTISLNVDYVIQGKDEDILDTIKHEVAHALVGPGHGHDWVWKKEAVKMGCTPRASAKLNKMPIECHKYNFIYQCSTCKTKFGAYRRHRVTHSCPNCSKTYNPKYLLVRIK